MPRIDFRSPRLYVTAPLGAGATLPLDRAQSNYLVNVLRLKPGDPVLVFNGRDGEWRTALTQAGRRDVALVAEACVRPQNPPGDLHLLFAPLKHVRLDYLVQKAVEMGVSAIHPVLTRHVQVTRLNIERMQANAVEAAEQCGILSLPEIAEPRGFDAVIGSRDPKRLLIFCDEDAETRDPVAALAAHRREAARSEEDWPLAVLTGPEGGFSEQERDALLSLPNVVRLSLGPRILRADTAVVAALAVVQAVLGDWR
jgi:16S rRNA (uracil1498-N3)-methyltransferase